MLDTLFLLAAEVHEEEPSKTAFYVLGGILAVWAVLLSAYGLRRADWPTTGGPAKAVMGVTALLVVGTMAASIATG
ncbi:hypothetical protein [Conexibacter sp. SYSU D00693]|uniref:hypothetical protein n=1 Tax=Conexibacter sp. SYSU D00693 TaxID=2812560 RepID=UPI00196B9D32|nr:hypothetical protein [Conexibacter sp. SYSU D00693]